MDWNVKLKEIKKDLVHLRFPNQYLMNSTMIRFQESHDSKRFRGKDFSLEEYMDWYVSLQNGTKSPVFDYFTEVVGMNMPSGVFKNWTQTHAEYTAKEDIICAIMSDYSMKNFYLICTYGEKSSAMKHEIAHGLYYLDKKYKKTVNEIVVGIDKTEINKFFVEMGYHKRVWKDEYQAYIMEGPKKLESAFKIDIKKQRKKIENVSNKLNVIWKEHFNAMQSSNIEMEFTL